MRPASYPCAGCLTDIAPEDVWGESLRTPLGVTFQRYHRRRECVQLGRERLAEFVGGPVNHYDYPTTREERRAEKVGA